MRLRAMLIDDEEPARDRLREMLAQLEDLELVGEAADGEEAVRKIASARPDLVFLDIEMPGLSGMQVAARLAPPRPRIIFCTAYDQYAIQAFEHHAADYLLKPVNRGRLEQAVDRVRRSVHEQESLRREVDDARRAQQRLLPRDLPPMRTLRYAGICVPARGVGGDYYDFLPLGAGRLGIVLGDVSGKGMFAGLLMAGLQARVQSMAPLFGEELDRMVGEANRLMHSHTDPNRFATFFYGLYDDASRRLTYVNAGHPPPLVLRHADDDARCRVERLEPNGTVIGLLPEASYRCSEVRLLPGDVLCLYSDGVTEAGDPSGEEFGTSRLEAVLRRCAADAPERVCDEVLRAVHAFGAGAEPEDDRTLVVGKLR